MSISPAGVGVSPDIIAQALPSDLSPLDPRSPYSWEQVDAYDPNDDLLEQFVVNMGPGVGTARTSPGDVNPPPAGVGAPLQASTPLLTQGPAAGVGSTAFNTRNLPGRASTPPGRGYLTAAARGKRPAVGYKQPRRVPSQNTPSTPSDPGSRRRSSASSSGGNGGRRSTTGGGDGGGGGGGGSGDDDDDDDSIPSGRTGPSRRRRRVNQLLNEAEMQQRLAQLLQDQQQTAAGRRIASITTTNTITTTYKNRQRPSVTRNSTSVRN